jgi:chemotaxis protein methyltransferase CheR
MSGPGSRAGGPPAGHGRGRRGAIAWSRRPPEPAGTLIMPAPGGVIPLSVPDGVPTLLRDLVHERTGIFFEPANFDTLLEKLRGRALHHGCQSYLDYYYILKYDERGPEEWLRVMDAFSVQETYFWREFAQINALARTVVPRWFKTSQSRLRIWSAACASGEEPYTLVMALIEAGLGNLPVDVFASDASEVALERARRGVYRDRSFRALPVELQARYFRRVTDGWQLDPDIMRRVTFQRANLISSSDIAPLAAAPVIFCRNVFIYFSPDSIRRTLAVLAERMPTGGHLFVGASESLLKLTTDFELHEIDGAFAYLRSGGNGTRP